MSKQTFPVRGMRDFLPADLERRNLVLDAIRKTVTELGFLEIETPCVEDINRLKSKQGGENESMIFEIMRRGLDPKQQVVVAEATDSGLRYDLTLPLSRYLAQNRTHLPSVARIFQTGPVWRAERPQQGRFRQFRQCDIDILGTSDTMAEVEVLTAGARVLTKLGLIDQCTLHINDRRLLDWLLEAAGITPDARPVALIELDKLDKISQADVIANIAALEGVGQEAAERFVASVLELKSQDLASAASQDMPTPDLATVIAQVNALAPNLPVVFDPSLVRGMGYYTGIIFEVKLQGAAGSICGGGRYDRMVGKWLGQDVPAVGFSFGFERLVDYVQLDEKSAADVVALGYRTSEEYAAALAHQAVLFDAGVRSGLMALPRKPKGAFFDQLVSLGFNRLLMPGKDGTTAEELLVACRTLGQ